MLSIGAADETLVAGLAGQLERALAELERAVELELVGGDHRQPIQRVRLGGRVAELARDLERGLMAAGARAGVRAKHRDAELVERLHLDRAIARCREASSAASKSAAAPGISPVR